MKQRAIRLFAILTTAIFVNFMFSNVCFIHVHKSADGTVTTHSHPYLPSGSHSHSSSSLAQIASFNISAATADVVANIPQMSPIEATTIIFEEITVEIEANVAGSSYLRGPPTV